MRIIHWAGDSTCAQNSYLTWPQTGIAQTFDRFTVPGVLVYDHAVNGRSTKSFIDEGRLDVIDSEIKEGDFLFIQFGHNDEKKNDPARYTDPDGGFCDNLRRFIDVARRRGASPLLITPVERRHFDDEGRLMETGHAPYAEACLRTGREENVPVVDLWSISRKWLARIGDEASRKYYMITVPGEFRDAPEGQIDNTHLKYIGAMEYAGFIAAALLDMGGEFAELVDKEKVCR